MTLQERILEAIGEKAVQSHTLYRLLTGEGSAAVDAAIRGLLKTRAVTFELGRYQRVMGRVAPRIELPTPPTQSVVSIETRAVPSLPAPASPVTHKLTRREREVLGLLESGVSHQEIAQQLGISRTCVSAHLSTARGKLGIRAPSANGKTSKPAPCAAVPRPAAPSHEDVEAATVGAGVFDGRIVNGRISAAKIMASGVQGLRPTFSPALIARLVEQQRKKAEELQAVLARADFVRLELADIEELVRIATEGAP